MEKKNSDDLKDIFSAMASFDDVVIESFAEELNFKDWASKCRDFESLSNPHKIDIWKDGKPAFWILLYLNFYTWLLRKSNLKEGIDIELFKLVAVCAKFLVQELKSHLSEKRKILAIDREPSVNFQTAKKIAHRMFQKEINQTKKSGSPKVVLPKKKENVIKKPKFMECTISDDAKQYIWDYIKSEFFKRKQKSTPVRQIYIDEPLDLLLFPQSEIKNSQELCIFLFFWHTNATLIGNYMDLVKKVFIAENSK